jgi:hypothetical protein
VFRSVSAEVTAETATFAKHINSVLGADKDLKGLLPINPASSDLYAANADGLLMAKMINAAVEGTIDERALNKPKKGKDLNVCVCACVRYCVGCIVVCVSCLRAWMHACVRCCAAPLWTLRKQNRGGRAFESAVARTGWLATACVCGGLKCMHAMRWFPTSSVAGTR